MRSRSLELPAAASPLPFFCGEDLTGAATRTDSGTVLQVFRTGFYVGAGAGNTASPVHVLPVLSPGALQLPTGLRCPGLDTTVLAGISAGEAVRITTDPHGAIRTLETETSRLTLCVGRTWRPARVARCSPVAVRRTSAAPTVDTVGPILYAHADAPDLVRRGRDLAASLGGTARTAPLTTPATMSGPGLMTEAVLALLGYGPGSTPSGDDLLCGAALMLHTLDNPGALAALSALRTQLTPELLHARTAALSASLVESALAGYCLPQVATALAALCAGEPASALDAVAPVGHSSGRDLLLGAALVLDQRAATTEAIHDVPTMQRTPLCLNC